MPATKKPAGKAKSAATGRYVPRKEAVTNRVETYLEGVRRDDKSVNLSLVDLKALQRAFHPSGKSVLFTGKQLDRINAELTRAIAAHERKVKK